MRIKPSRWDALVAETYTRPAPEAWSMTEVAMRETLALVEALCPAVDTKQTRRQLADERRKQVSSPL